MKKDHRKMRRRPLFTPLLAPILGGVIILMLVGLLWTAQSVSTVILVRHADTEETEAGTPGLSDTGVYRAKVLAGWLGRSGLSKIYVSEHLPSQQTAEAVAEATGAEVVVLPPTDIRALIEAVSGLRGETVLVIGQSDTLPDIIESLAGQLVEIADNDYSGMYIVTDSVLTRARLLQLQYGG